MTFISTTATTAKPTKMVFDTRGMVQHYRRIYNAKPSPEIARTRASSATRKRPSTAGNSSRSLSRRSTSFQSLNRQTPCFDGGLNFANDVGWLGLMSYNGLEGYPSAAGRPHGQQLQQQQQQQPLARRPFSANVAPAQRSKSNLMSSGASRRAAMQKSARPNSALVASRMTTKKQDPGARMRPGSGHFQAASNYHHDDDDVDDDQGFNFDRFSDQHASNFHRQRLVRRRDVTNDVDDVRRFGSMHSLNHLGFVAPVSTGLRRTTSLSERIDDFLDAVQREEEQLQHQRQVAQLMSGRSTGRTNTR